MEGDQHGSALDSSVDVRGNGRSSPINLYDFYNSTKAKENGSRRTFRFSIRALVSRQGNQDEDNEQLDLGFFFTEDDEMTLDSLAKSSQRYRYLAAQAAWEWLQRECHLIVTTIFRLDYETQDALDYAAALSFLRIEQVGDRVHFVFDEKSSGLVSYDLLWKLRDNVNWGGDTWDCGDFGFVTNTLDGSLLRVSLARYGSRSMHKSDWVPALPEREQGNCIQPNLYFDRRFHLDPSLANLIIFPLFLLLALFAYIKRGENREEEHTEDTGRDERDQ
ncbi:hypothetical protein ACA910_005930 [Epithemia clementina (nom. ined.)]